MKTATSLVLLLAASFPATFGAPFSSISTRRVHVHTKEEALAQSGGTALYNALEDAFSMINSQHPLARRADLTLNELEQGKCGRNIIIYARGTTEGGNMGDSAGLGALLQNGLNAALPGRVIYQGVNNYPADVWGYLGGGSDTAAANMTAQVSLAAKQCPGSRVFLSGYSQGAQVAHKAAKLIPTSQYGIIGGFVLFGDPNEGDALPGILNNNVLTICNDGDLICDGYPIPLGSHLEYAPTIPQAVAWIKARAL